MSSINPATPGSKSRRKLTSFERSLNQLKSGGHGGRAESDDEWHLPSLGLKRPISTPALSGKRVRRKMSKAAALEIQAVEPVAVSSPLKVATEPPPPLRSN